MSFSALLTYIILLLLVSRLVLAFVGGISREAAGYCVSCVPYMSVWLGVYAAWDSGWYLEVARDGYSPKLSSYPPSRDQGNFAFFPLYPLLLRTFGGLIGDYVIAGLLVSNVCLVLSAVIIYYMALADSGELAASKAVKYLFLYPASFILSAVMAESLMLFLTLSCFYSARRGLWVRAGFLGLLATLTKPIGLLAMPALAYLYLRDRRYDLKAVGPEAAALFLPLLGFMCYMAYVDSIVGEPMSYFSIMHDGWHHNLSNPVSVMAAAISSEYILHALFVIAAIALFAWSYGRIDKAYWVFGVLLLLAPILAQGGTTLYSMPRYLSIVFPLYLILGEIGRDREADQFMTTLFLISQPVAMAFWTTASGILI